jgi:acetolactate synthase-1/2/3 large subunit
MTVSGGELLARALKAADVKVVFALHGGHLDPFLLACQEIGIKLIDGRHEGAVGHAAEGYAKASGTLGVAAVTAGAGFANGVASLVSAHTDRTPMLMITSSPPLAEAELNELQGGIDQVAVARPVTRWAPRVTATRRIPDLTALAVRKALGVPPGPVLLEVPVDLMFAEVDETRIVPSGHAIVAPLPGPAEEAVEAAGSILRSARRPVIVAGNGLRYARAEPALRAFADRSGIPVFSQMGTSWLPNEHPLKAFGAWYLAALGQQDATRPDAVLLAGARMGRYLGGRTGSIIPHSARIVQIDIDASEIGRLGPVDQPVVADAAQALRSLAADPRAWPDWSGWAAAATGAHRARSQFADEPHYLSGRMHPYHAVRTALEQIPHGSTIVVDGGEAAGWVWESLARSRHRDVIGFGGYTGILGASTGMAIGAQVARPGTQVVLFCGDGAAGFHIQEFDTMVRHSLPIVVVVVNNALWGQSVRGQEKRYGKRGVVISRLDDTGYELVARGFGARGERVAKLEDVPGAMNRSFAEGRPACVNLSVAYGPEPRTAAGMSRRPASGEISLPYYETTATAPGHG